MIRKKQENYGPYVIDLTGPQGNAFVLLGYAKQFARQLQFDDELKNKKKKITKKLGEAKYFSYRYV